MANQTNTQLLERLISALYDLPPDKLPQVFDFVGYLQGRYGQGAARRGSGRALIEAIEGVGQLQFAPGELDAILDDINAARELSEER
jgi:hypothetical protein